MSENIVKADHGCFPWNEGVEVKCPYQEDLDGLYEWLGYYGVADHIAQKLHEQKYLTEGEFAELIGFKSKLSEADRFFCGDKEAYEKAVKEKEG